MRLGWFKLSTEIMSDPKVLLLDYETRWFVVDCFCIASTVNEGGRLGTLEEIALILPRCEKGEKKKLSALAKAGIVHEKKGVWHVTNWVKRQGKPSDQPERVADRQRRSRATKNKEKSLTPLSHPPCRVTGAIQDGRHASVTPQKRREEKRRDKKQELTTTTAIAISPSVDKSVDNPKILRLASSENRRPELKFLAETVAKVCAADPQHSECYAVAEAIWDNFPEVTPATITEIYGPNGWFEKKFGQGSGSTHFSIPRPQSILETLERALQSRGDPAEIQEATP